jgi:hypothetical protein
VVGFRYTVACTFSFYFLLFVFCVDFEINLFRGLKEEGRERREEK